ncbi:MAG: GxxExxY protein [bacterium]
MILEKALTEQIVGSAIEVYRHLGPGLLESAYEECLYHELYWRGLNFERQRPLPLEYKGILNGGGFSERFSCLPFEPNSVRCPQGFAPRHQRNGSTPA